MNRTPDVQLVLDEWLTSEHDVAPDRVLEVVADRIARQPQRRRWRLPWRTTHMNRPVAYLAAFAAALAVAIVGWNLLPRTGGIGGTPTPSPAASETTSPTAAIPLLRAGQLAPGPFRLYPYIGLASTEITLTAPAGWTGFPSWALLGPNGTGAPNGIGVGVLAPAGLFSDPCHWDIKGDHSWPQQGDISVGLRAVDLASGLLASHSYIATASADVTVGGFVAKRVDLQLPSDIDFTKCDNLIGEPGVYFVWGTQVPDGSDLYAQGPGTRWRLWIMDTPGQRVVIVVGDYAGTPEADRAAAQAIVDSITIKP